MVCKVQVSLIRNQMQRWQNIRNPWRDSFCTNNCKELASDFAGLQGISTFYKGKGERTLRYSFLHAMHASVIKKILFLFVSLS